MTTHGRSQALAVDAGTTLRQQLALVSRLLGMSQGEYVRFALLRQIMADLQQLPARHLVLRPGALVYTSPAPGVYIPATRGLGGERVWLLGHATDLPASVDAGGGYGYFADITRGDVRGGIEGRGVFVRFEDVGAPTAGLARLTPLDRVSESS